MAVAVPNVAVATIIGTGLAEWTLGTNLFAGPVTQADPSGVPSPVKVVFVLASGGPEPRRTFGTPKLGQPAVQIRIRWDRDDFEGGEVAARAIRDEVDSADLGAGYLNFRVLESEPIYIGQTDSAYHEWTINGEAMHQP